MTPVGKGGAPAMTPIGKGSAPEGKTLACLTTPAGKTGEVQKTLEQWEPILRSLPTATASDRARLGRLFERVLGSGSGNEELDVASHKDKEAYVALWLYRIALDPDEGTTYTKFMRKWGIGRKCAVVYVQQALMASEDKALKSLQEGIDADAQPIALLEELLKRNNSGEDLKDACACLLKKFPEANAMLNSKQTISSAAPGSAPALSFSTPAPKSKPQEPQQPQLQVRTEIQAQRGGCDDTIVDEEGPTLRNSRNNQDVEETVIFGSKMSATKGPAPTAMMPAAGTPAAATTPAAAARTGATKPKAAAAANQQHESEETVMFGAKVLTPGGTQVLEP